MVAVCCIDWQKVVDYIVDYVIIYYIVASNDFPY